MRSPQFGAGPDQLQGCPLAQDVRRGWKGYRYRALYRNRPRFQRTSRGRTRRRTPGRALRLADTSSHGEARVTGKQLRNPLYVLVLGALLVRPAAAQVAGPVEQGL